MSGDHAAGWRARMRHRMGERLFERVVAASADDLRPRIDAGTVLAIGLSVVILLTPVAVAGLGVFLIVWSGFAVIATIIGVGLLVLAWVLLPQVNRLGTPAYERGDLPELFSLVDRLGRTMGAPRVDAITIDPSFNAFIGQFGRRRRRVLGIGLALWQVLEPRERVAVLAHELGHEINGDPARSILIRMAEQTLEAWIATLKPERSGAMTITQEGVGIGEQVAELIAWLVSLVQRALVRLHMQRSQVAEYYADLLAARMAGHDAEVASQLKLVLRPAVESHLFYRRGRDPGAGHALMSELKGYLNALRPEVVEKLQRTMRTERSSIDATHPPTVYRLNFLAHHSALPGEFDADSVDWAAIDAELEPFLEPMGQALLADHLWL